MSQDGKCLVILVVLYHVICLVDGDKTLLMQTKLRTSKVPATAADRVLMEMAARKSEVVREVLRDAEDHEPSDKSGQDHHKNVGADAWSQLFHWAMENIAQNENDSGSHKVKLLDHVGPEVVVLGKKEESRNPVKRQAHESLAKKKVEFPQQVTEFEIMERALYTLRDENARLHDRVEALGILEDLCHSIDNGKDLHSLGGLKDMSRFLERDGEADMQSAALWAVATCTQNNPVVQEQFILLGLVPRLVRLAERNAEANVRAKCLFALAALLDSPKGRTEFRTDIDRNTAVLRASLDDLSNHRAIRRALSIASILIREDPSLWAQPLDRSGFLQAAQELLDSHENYDVRESAATYIANARVSQTRETTSAI